jgi:AcrR family transcriptional regulator
MSPRTARQFEEIRETSRQKILDAAFELFAKHGYNNTSIAQVAKKASVAKGLIYNYFDKKEDLMYHIVVDGMKEAEGVVHKILKAEAGKPRLRLMLDIAFDSMSKQPEYQKLMAQIALQLDQFPALKDIVKAKYQGMMPLLAQALQDANFPEPEKEARFLGAVLDGIGLQYLVMQEAMDLETHKNDLIEKYCS